jgi:MATE family multidrug resistance protein
MMIAALLFLTVPRQLIALYTSDSQVMAVGPGLLGLAAAFELFDGIQTVSTGALRGLGETRITLLANLAGYWVLGVPLGMTLCFVFHWGVYGLWTGLTSALIVIAIMLLLRWKRDSKRLTAGGARQ